MVHPLICSTINFHALENNLGQKSQGVVNTFTNMTGSIVPVSIVLVSVGRKERAANNYREI